MVYTITMSLAQYFGIFNIKIDEMVEADIQEASDISVVFDACYLFNTEDVNYDTYASAKRIVKAYFDDNPNPIQDAIDLSLSPSSTYWVYSEVHDDDDIDIKYLAKVEYMDAFKSVKYAFCELPDSYEVGE